jgi:hypothetical protein
MFISSQWKMAGIGAVTVQTIKRCKIEGTNIQNCLDNKNAQAGTIVVLQHICVGGFEFKCL